MQWLGGRGGAFRSVSDKVRGADLLVPAALLLHTLRSTVGFSIYDFRDIMKAKEHRRRHAIKTRTRLNHAFAPNSGWKDTAGFTRAVYSITE